MLPWLLLKSDGPQKQALDAGLHRLFSAQPSRNP